MNFDRNWILKAKDNLFLLKKNTLTLFVIELSIEDLLHATQGTIKAHELLVLWMFGKEKSLFNCSYKFMDQNVCRNHVFQV